MNPIVSLIWYIINSALCILCLVVKLTSSRKKIDLLLLLIFSSIYFVFMLFYTIVHSCGKCKGIFCCTRKSFMQDLIYKYVCSIIIGCNLFFELIYLLKVKSYTLEGSNDWEKVISCYVLFIFPVLCFVDLFITSRSRSPMPMLDIVILFAIALIVTVIQVSQESNSFGEGVKYFFGFSVMRIVFSFNGYLIYDFTLFKKNGGAGGFVLFYA